MRASTISTHTHQKTCREADLGVPRALGLARSDEAYGAPIALPYHNLIKDRQLHAGLDYKIVLASDQYTDRLLPAAPIAAYVLCRLAPILPFATFRLPQVPRRCTWYLRSGQAAMTAERSRWSSRAWRIAKRR